MHSFSVITTIGCHSKMYIQCAKGISTILANNVSQLWRNKYFWRKHCAWNQRSLVLFVKRNFGRRNTQKLWLVSYHVFSQTYKITHFRRFTGSGGSSAAKIASSKTFFKPFCVSAEHSTYLTAFSSLASFSPCSTDMGFCLFLASFSIVVLSSLRSTCVPTSRKGVFWQWWVISGTHFSFTFSNEEGLTTEKHTKKTSVWG